MNNTLDKIRGSRGANNVLRAGLAFNALLTFVFGFEFLHPMFNVFGVDVGSPSFVVFKVMGGVFLVVVADACFYAWGIMSRQEENTSEQIVTAQDAKKWSLWGSLAASAAAIVMLQNAVELDSNIKFVVSLVGVLAGAALAIAHVYWWDKFRKESSSYTEQEDRATDNADRYSDQRKQRQEEMKLQRKTRKGVTQVRGSADAS